MLAARASPSSGAAFVRRTASESFSLKPGLHPRNLHRADYDFAALTAASPRLAPFLRPSLAGTNTIDFADPAAVLALNQALLKKHYGVAHWDLPPGYLCPPVPGRADYLHHLADLLSGGKDAAIPRGGSIRILDIGVGANCIYPMIGASVYGWRFVGTDIDPIALNAAREIISANPPLRRHLELRLQPTPTSIFHGVIQSGESFAASICNPPFHASSAEAQAGTARKLRNLHGSQPAPARLNFGGQSHELWCRGGELAFVRRIIEESAAYPKLCGWFTTLVSKRENLPAIQRTLHAVAPAETRTMDVSHGQKKSRIVAWRF